MDQGILMYCNQFGLLDIQMDSSPPPLNRHELQGASCTIGGGITKIKRTRRRYIHFQHLIEVENADKAHTNVRV